MNNKIKENTNTLDLTQWEALKQLDKSIKNGHIIRQSMKYQYVNIREWINKTDKDTIISMPVSKFDDLVKCYRLDIVKMALIKWIKDTYQPTAILSIQLPNNQKTENMDNTKKKLRKVMASFERQLLGRHWYDYYLPFICLMEEGISGCWHVHILFNQGKFKPWHLWLALDNTIHDLNWSEYCMHLDMITADREKAISYCLKEIKVNCYGHFESNRFILSDELFRPNHTNYF